MQTKSLIKKAANRTDTQYTTLKGFVIVNGLTNEMTYGSNNSDSLCGLTNLEAGLEMIQWDDSKDVKIENISWL